MSTARALARSRRARRSPHAAGAGEAGFTLPELMVGIVILGIIIVPVTSAIIVGLLTTGDAQNRLEDTQSALMSSAFWAGDVQSADGTVRTTGGPSCGSGGTHLVSFVWADDLSPTNAASYVIEANDSGNRKIVRRFCRGGSQVTAGTVAPEVGATNPTVTCTPGCDKPTSVSMTMTTPRGFTFSLNATRRSTS